MKHWIARLLLLVFGCLAAASTGTLLSTASATPVPSQTGSVMLGARVVGDSHRVRFVADLSQAVIATVFTLGNPYRIVVDLPSVRFALPADAGTTGRGLITSFRYGMISPGRSRIVIDLNGPAKIDKEFTLAPSAGQPARLVIDAVPTDNATFLAETRAYKEKELQTLAEEAPAAPVVRQGGKRIICIDPGHGGIDPGAHGAGGLLEKNVTLAFAKVLGGLLASTGHYQVVYTRDDDSYVSLAGRVEIARRNKADLFLSIHSNWFPARSVRGTTIYTVSDKASDKMAAALANSENQSDALAGVDTSAADSDQVKNILIDLTRRETQNFGVVFARNLVRELGKTNHMFKVPHKEASFRVLEAPDIPSALIELGYITNPIDAKHLVDPSWQEKTAESMVKAIDDYFRTRDTRRGIGETVAQDPQQQ